MTIPIGELSRRAQVKVPTIRYYEQVGLLPPPPRTTRKMPFPGSISSVTRGS